MNDNPNPQANIGFICYYPLQYYVYKNIYRHLPNAEFIVDGEYTVHDYTLPADYPERLSSFFDSQGIYWRKLSTTDTTLTRQEFFSKYGVLVNTLYDKNMAAPYMREKKLVRVMYGYAKDPWNFGPWSAYFDKVLSYGPYAQQFLSIYGNAVAVGNPKFDDWYTLTPHKKKPGSPCSVLYLPTWGALSSLDKIISAIHTLSREYRFTIKAHHMTTLLHPEQIVPFADDERITIVDDTADVLPLLQEADIVLSDNSGGIFDAVLADKPIVLINTINQAQLRPKALFHIQQGRRSGVSTSASSFEQQVRQPGQAVGPLVEATDQKQLHPGLLREAFHNAHAQEEMYAPRRKLIRDQAFAYQDGTAGKRAAQEILELLHAPKPKRNFLAESIDMYVQELFAPSISLQTDYAEIIEQGKKFAQLKQLPYTQRLREVFKTFF